LAPGRHQQQQDDEQYPESDSHYPFCHGQPSVLRSSARAHGPPFYHPPILPTPQEAADATYAGGEDVTTIAWMGTAGTLPLPESSRCGTIAPTSPTRRVVVRPCYPSPKDQRSPMPGARHRAKNP
jgi:hypothetical protein